MPDAQRWRLSASGGSRDWIREKRSEAKSTRSIGRQRRQQRVSAGGDRSFRASTGGGLPKGEGGNTRISREGGAQKGGAPGPHAGGVAM